MLTLSIVATLALSAPKVHVHAAGDSAFRANAYLVEGEKGVVAVDAPFIVSEARAFRKELDALKKPLVAVLVTHAHPDHVNGITELVVGKTEVPVVAIQGVADTLKAIDGPKRSYWAPIYKDEYPAKTTFPNRIVKAGEAVSFGDLKFTPHDLGQGESDSETVWVLENAAAAFTGDLVMNRVHAWLAEGHSSAWLTALAKAEKELAKVKVLYPGHGASGTLEALAWQKQYLETYRTAVKELAKGKPTLDAGQKAELEKKMGAFLPNAPLAMLVGMSADSVAGELVKQ